MYDYGFDTHSAGLDHYISDDTAQEAAEEELEDRVYLEIKEAFQATRLDFAAWEGRTHADVEEKVEGLFEMNYAQGRAMNGLALFMEARKDLEDCGGRHESLLEEASMECADAIQNATVRDGVAA